MDDLLEQGKQIARRAVGALARATTSWWVQDGGRTRQMSEEKLRRRIRHNDYSGLELAHRDGETDWRPLHTFELFREEVPHDGNSERVAALRALRGWALHSLAFIGFVGLPFMGVFHEFQWWMLFVLFGWGAGFLTHTMKILPALRSLRGILDPVSGAHPAARTATAAASDSAAQAAKAPTATSAASASPSAPPPDPFLAQIDTALAEVGRAFDAAPDEKKIDLPAIRAAAENLHRRRVALTAVGGEAAVASLAAEQEAAKARVAAAAGDPRSAAVLQEELDAITARLAATREATAAEMRLLARERALLHQLESLRVSLLRASVEDPSVDQARASLADAVTRVSADLAAESEIDDHVARATKRTLAGAT